MHEFARLLDDGPVVGGGRDRDAAPPAELEQPLVAQLPERAQGGVPVDLEDGRKIAGRRQPLAGLRLPFGDRPPDLSCHLLMQFGRFGAIDLDTEHGASDTSFSKGPPLMSVLTQPRPPQFDDHPDAEALEALIEEARRRARRRRRGYAAAAALVAAGLLGLYVVNDDDGDTDGTNGEAGIGSQVTDGKWRAAPGLEGGRITALTVDPRHPETVFAATLDAGIFKSANGARKWRQLDLPSAVSRVDAVAIAAGDPKTIYAGTARGVLRTTDGGRKWQATSSDLLGKETAERRAHRLIEGYVYTIAVDPRDADIAYAGTWEKGIFKTQDGGRSWRSIGPKGVAVNTFALDPRAPDTVYAGLRDAWGESGVIKSTDGGATWHPTGMRGLHVTALALDPKHPETVFAGTELDGIFKTTDGGASWRSAGLKEKVATISGLALDPNDTNIAYATTWGKGVFKTEDGGRTWRRLDAGDVDDAAAPKGSPYALTRCLCSWPGAGTSSSAVALNPRHPATIYAGIGGGADGEGGVSKSLDGGHSWRPMIAGLTAARVSALALDPGDDGTAYAAVDGRGVFKRVNGRWRAATKGLTHERVHAVAVDPQDPATVYAGTNAGVFKSTNGAASWRVSFTPWDLNRVSALAIDPQDPTTVYAHTVNDATVYGSLVVKSTNGGHTWPTTAQVQAVEFPEARRAGLGRLSGPLRLTGDGALVQAVPASPLAIAPLDPEVLYAGGLGVRKSVDGGITWRSAGLGRRPVTALAVDPNEAATVYASTDAGLFKSTGAGLSWRPLRGALDGVRVEALAIDPKYRGTVYAGTDRGVFWSADGGDSWRRFTHLPLRSFAAVAVDRAAGVLYAGAYGGGIYELNLVR